MDETTKTIYDYAQRIIVNKLLATEALHNCIAEGKDEIEVKQYRQGESKPEPIMIKLKQLRQIAYTNPELSAVARDAKQFTKEVSKKGSKG